MSSRNMNRRLLLGGLLVAVMALSAGCTGMFGSQPIDQERLNAPADYDWSAPETDVYVDVAGGQYQAIHAVSNRSSIAVYEFAELGEERPVDVSSVQFRYQNGTVVTVANTSSLSVEKRDSRTVVSLPNETGQLAYTAPTAGGGSLQIPTAIDGGSYEMVLPPDTRVGNPLLGTVNPGYTESELIDGRLHLTWRDVSADSISVRYYLVRDMWLFLGVIAVASLVGIGLIGYVWLQIRGLVKKRERLGLNIDVSDDDSGGGPPRP